MKSLVTRFHTLFLTLAAAIAVVGYLRIPADFTFPAHWAGSTADWLWPRDALLVAPMVQIVLMVIFWLIGRSLTRNHFAKVQHILDPLLSLLLAVPAACQLGLLLIGIGSDLDFIRFTCLALGIAMLPLGLVLFEAERHTYAGLRMPWPIEGQGAWTLVHRITGLACGLCGLGLLATAWLDLGLALSVLSLVAALATPILAAALASVLASPR